ncbi:MAG: hypothetical protein EBR45_12390 [Betaproteobacteria bacterium]|nr:hypothetical protein [Betaproteobacteria bacterium]
MGYVLHRSTLKIRKMKRSKTKPQRRYTYPQSTISKSASAPGSNFSRHGGSVFSRREQAWQ